MAPGMLRVGNAELMVVEVVAEVVEGIGLPMDGGLAVIIIW